VRTIFSSSRRVWRCVKPLDEGGLCRAFAAWDAERSALAHWVSGPGLPYDACIAGVSAQMVADRRDDYRAPFRRGQARVLVGNDAIYVLAGCDMLYLAVDPEQRTSSYDPYPALGDVLTWLWHCRSPCDIDTAVLLNGEVEEAVVSLADRPPELYPIAFS